MSDSIDIESYCRVCLQQNETNLSIYDEVQEFSMSICDLLIFYGEMTINDKDVYPKIICDECLRELLVVTKFKEKVKLAEHTLGQLITADDRTSNCDEVIIEETEDSEIDGYVTIKRESEAYVPEEEVVNTGSYEEVEFLDLNGPTETLNTVQYVTVGKCDDEFIDEIIEECSVDDSDIVETIVSDTTDTINRSAVKQKSPSKQTPQHLSPSDSKVIINFNCAFCGAGFMHSSNLKKHMLTHRSETFDLHATDLNDQMKVEEPAEPQIVTGKISKKNIVKPHKCELCDRAFVSRSLLSSHNRTHTGERPFACNQCEKNFATQGGLDLHTRRHLGLKNYVCNICDRRFVESSNLKVHMRTHTGERPHRCNRCNRSFSRVFLLQIHQRTHTGERPHQCPICFKGFAQQGDLSAHRRIHSGERPHQCGICFKGFIKSSALTSHMKRHTDKTVYDSSNTSMTIVK
ncbi:zinc finger protein 12-like isoform X1 [Bradysia coprophila]|uniref:zinc finger protein 12-like isoform X1 n=1 Tax=Bradysia coprophila TaxID=38358 RepID=UPI00187DD629|nr:zinc finger protein 12-like isoform X1 [Bradysia coprophila]